MKKVKMILVGMFMMVGGFIYAQDGTINMSVYNLADEKLGEEQITGHMELIINEIEGTITWKPVDIEGMYEGTQIILKKKEMDDRITYQADKMDDGKPGIIVITKGVHDEFGVVYPEKSKVPVLLKIQGDVKVIIK